MMKNEQSREINQPVWFDGKSINEALFCDDFLSRHKIIYTNGAFFTPDGRVTNDLPLHILPKCYPPFVRTSMVAVGVLAE